MTSIIGANLQDLATLAQQFSQSAEQLRLIRSTLTQRVVNNQGWRGGDADRFKAHWGSHDAALAGIAGSLDTGSQQLVDNVREQEQASDQASGSAAGVGGSGGPGSSGAGSGPGGAGDGEATSGGNWLLEAIAAGSVAVPLGLKIKDAIGLLRTPSALLDSKRLLDVTNGIRNATYADEFVTASRFSKALRFGGPALAPFAIAGGIHDMIDPAHSGARGVGDRVAGGLSVIGGGGTLLMAAGLLNPVGAGIVIGAGLAAGAWAAGNYIYDNWDNITEFTGNVGESISDAGSAVKDYAGDRLDDASEVIGDAAENIGDAADDVGDFMKDPVGSLGGLFS